MNSHYEVKSLSHFLRRVAIDYLRYGYFRYALREIPFDKNPEWVDKKILSVYNITRCRTTRMRRKANNIANVQYIRLHHSFLLLATEGIHSTFDRIKSYDFRTVPLHFRGYSIGVLQGKPCVRVSHYEWHRVEERFSKIGLHARAEVERKLNALPYYGFPGVIRQKLTLTQAINRRRKRAGLPLVTLQIRPSKSSHGHNQHSPMTRL